MLPSRPGKTIDKKIKMLCVQKLWKPESPQQLRGKQNQWRIHSHKPSHKYFNFNKL